MKIYVMIGVDCVGLSSARGIIDQNVQRGFLSTALYSSSDSDNWLERPLIRVSDEG